MLFTTYFGSNSSRRCAVIVEFHPWPLTFIHIRKIFRFVSRTENGVTVWDKQPSSEGEKAFGKFLKSSLQPLPDMNKFR
jgi:hypothetical protein